MLLWQNLMLSGWGVRVVSSLQFSSRLLRNSARRLSSKANAVSFKPIIQRPISQSMETTSSNFVTKQFPPIFAQKKLKTRLRYVILTWVAPKKPKNQCRDGIVSCHFVDRPLTEFDMMTTQSDRQTNKQTDARCQPKMDIPWRREMQSFDIWGCEFLLFPSFPHTLCLIDRFRPSHEGRLVLSPQWRKFPRLQININHYKITSNKWLLLKWYFIL